MLLRLFLLWTRLVLRFLGASRKRYQIGETSLLVHRLGPEDGEPWVLLHGLGSTSLSWHRIARALRSECRLVIPELSALGGTATPRHGLGVADGARVVGRLIERELPGRRVNLGGISLGGWIAVRATLARPDQVGRLLLIDCAGYLDQDWERIQDLTRIDDLAGVERLYKVLFQRTPWILRRSKGVFLRAYSSPAVRQIFDTTTEADGFTDRDLARIEVPVGLIWGERDGLFELAVARAMAAALPDARLEVLEGAGHAVHWERPKQLVRAVRAFRDSTHPRQG